MCFLFLGPRFDPCPENIPIRFLLGLPFLLYHHPSSTGHLQGTLLDAFHLQYSSRVPITKGKLSWYSYITFLCASTNRTVPSALTTTNPRACISQPGTWCSGDFSSDCAAIESACRLQTISISQTRRMGQSILLTFFGVDDTKLTYTCTPPR